MANTIEVVIKATDQASAVIDKVEANITTGTTNAAKSIDKLTQKSAESAGGFSKMQASIVTAAQAVNLIGTGLDSAKNIIEQSIVSTMAYNKSVRDLAQNLGITTEETSRIIQTADDFTVSQENVTAALQMALRKGFSPSIETLARMADEYNSMISPTERAAKMTEVFGRNWTTLVPLLKEGGKAIRDAAAAQSNSLIVTEEQSKKTRELEVAIDGLNDKMEGIKLTIGNKLIPILVDATNALGYMTNGIGSVDEEENRLSATIAKLLFYYGYENKAVRDAEQALRDYLAVRQQVAMTDPEKQLRANIASFYELSSATQANIPTMASLSDATGIASGVMDGLTEAQKRHDEIAADFAAKTAANTQALADYRAGISETIGKIDSMAQSLKDATNAQAVQALAQGQLDVLKKAYETGAISADQLKNSTDALLLKYGLATPKSIAMAEAQDKINQAFLAGQLPLDKYIASTSSIPRIAADGKVTLQELTSLGIEPTTAAARDQTTAIDNLTSAWSKVPRDVKTVYTIETQGTAPSGSSAQTTQNTTVHGYAAGGEFVVPPNPRGGNGDYFMAAFAPGEHVSATPAGRGGNMPSINITQSFSGAQAEPEKYKAIMYEVITDVIEQAMRQ